MDPRKFTLVVTSGPTREWIDPVRFISNPSSGLTGWNIARLGAERFQKVVFISGPGSPAYTRVDDSRVKTVSVQSTADMGAAVLEHMSDYTLLIMSAAPADYTPAEPANLKIKKTPGSSAELTLRLKPTMDILSAVGERRASRNHFYSVGFAAETNDVVENARGKLKRKKLDFICANQVERTTKGFGENENTWLVIGAEGEPIALGPAPKSELAEKLLNLLVERLD